MLQDANVAYDDDVENFIVDDMLCSVLASTLVYINI